MDAYPAPHPLDSWEQFHNTQVRHDGFEWAMELCLGQNADPVEMRFPKRSAAEEWLRENHPDFFRHGVWRGEGDGGTWFQYGTGYYWASFHLAPRRVAA